MKTGFAALYLICSSAMVAQSVASTSLLFTANPFNITFGSPTGASNMMTVTDTESNSGTGYVFTASTATGSAAKPFQVNSAGINVIDTDTAGGLTLGSPDYSHPVIVRNTIEAGLNVGAANAFWFYNNNLLMQSNPAIGDSGNAYEFADNSGNTLRQIQISSLWIGAEKNGTRVGGFDTSGNALIHGLTYTWPTTQSSGALRNDGSGNLSFDASTAAHKNSSLPQIFTWYVDSVNGSDTNTGHALSQAYKTIGKLMAQILSTGDSICLANGSTWRETLTLPANDMTVAACGPGTAAPILDSSDIIATGSWSKTAGQTNVYQTTVALETGSVATWVNAFENGAYLVRAASIADCDSTAGSYYPSSDSNSSITLYVHSTGSTNPASDGHSYEYTHRLNGLNADTPTGSLIAGITAKRPLGQTGAFDIGRASTLVNSLALQSGEHAVYVRSGSYVGHVTAQDAYWGSSTGIMFVGYDDSAIAGGITFYGDTAVNNITIGTQEGFYTHTGLNKTLPFVAFDHCRAMNVIHGFGGDNAGIINADNDTAIVTGAGGGFLVSAPMMIHGGSVRSESPNAMGVKISNNSTTVAIYGLHAYLPDSSSNAIGQYTGLHPVSVQVYDSTLISGGATISLSGANASITASGNIMQSLSALQYIQASGTGSAITSDMNAYYVSGGSAPFSLAGVAYANLPSWTAATGNDGHSTVNAGAYPLTQSLLGSGISIANGQITMASSTAPTCSAATSGTLQFNGGSPGEKAELKLCAKDASDVYDWRVLY
jgi:hypothetical protein